MASRKGYYRAAHYVRPSGLSGRSKKPATWVIVVVVVLIIAGWNTLFGSDSDKSRPAPEKTGPSAPASPGQ